MIAFADTDVLIELAALDLLGEFLTAFELSASDVYVLPREEKRLGSSDIVADYGSAASSRAVSFAQSAKKIGPYDQSEYVLLLKVSGIDPGEAVLFSATASLNVDYVVTGDGRALRGLASAASARAISTRLAGKIICLEQVLLELIGQQGFAAIRDKVVRGTTTNIAINNMFRAGGQGTEVAVMAALRSRVDDLRNSTGSLLSEYHGA